jgi:hypothetical protein
VMLKKYPAIEIAKFSGYTNKKSAIEIATTKTKSAYAD